MIEKDWFEQIRRYPYGYVMLIGKVQDGKKEAWFDTWITWAESLYLDMNFFDMKGVVDSLEESGEAHFTVGDTTWHLKRMTNSDLVIPEEVKDNYTWLKSAERLWETLEIYGIDETYYDN